MPRVWTSGTSTPNYVQIEGVFSLMRCNVCLAELGKPVYESRRSLTSLCELSPDPTVVRFCTRCGHLQTDAITNVESYYDEDYEILTDSEEEDQIYEITEGNTIYRTDHQVRVLLNKTDLPGETRILDFGCAKSSTMQCLLKLKPDVEPHLYDVSDRYLHFWERFAKPENVAIYELPKRWDGYFDIVTSFFSLEHITRPLEVVRNIVRLLKPGGVFYGIVPNVFTNTADLIVIDHANHFTRSSLAYLLNTAGLDVVDIDADCHRGAYVWRAVKPSDRPAEAREPDPAEVHAHGERGMEIAEFWSSAADRIRVFESTVPDNADTAIYGAGFYGTFIHSSLREPRRVRCLVDQNEFLQGKLLHDAPVVAPADLPASVEHLLVGLNPARARAIVADIPALAARKIDYFFL